MPDTETNAAEPVSKQAWWLGAVALILGYNAHHGARLIEPEQLGDAIANTLIILALIGLAVSLRFWITVNADNKWSQVAWNATAVAILVPYVLPLTAPSPPQAAEVQVEASPLQYILTGDAKTVNVIYRSPESMRQQKHVEMPWVYQAEMPEGSGAYLNPTIGVGGGTVTCTIKFDGAIVRTLTASGAGTTMFCEP